MSNLPVKRWAIIGLATAVALYVAFWLLRFVASTVFDIAIGLAVVALLVYASKVRARVRQDGWRSLTHRTPV